MAPSTSALPASSASIIIKKRFSAGAVQAVRAILSKESRTETLTIIGEEEAVICSDVAETSTAPKDIKAKADEDNYDGNESDSDDVVAEISDEAEDKATEATSKPTKDEASLDNEAGKGEDAEADQTKGSDEKKSTGKHENQDPMTDQLVSIWMF